MHDMNPDSSDEIKVFWQPGCTSCLRTKEFLTRHQVPFTSVNVMEHGFKDLTRFGLRQVPIVTRGDHWANGQVLEDVARLTGITLKKSKLLSPPELQDKLVDILRGARRYLDQIPETDLTRNLPDRPRSYADLVHHIFNVADALLEHERGIPLVYASYNRTPESGKGDKASLCAYADEMIAGVQRWWEQGGSAKDFSLPADVYYGRQTLRDYLERTTWHCGQHTRQLMMVLETMGLTPDRPLGPSTFAGLPMPEKVWDS